MNSILSFSQTLDQGMAVASEMKEKIESPHSMELAPSSPFPSYSSADPDAIVDPNPDPDPDPETSSLISAAAMPGVGDLSDRRDQSDPSTNLPGDDEIQSQLALRSEEYRLLFHLPPEEVLVQDFNCALQENILLQGHMYLFVHHICFYSNIFGFETKKTIPFNEVTFVRKAKTAAIFPNAIEIVAGEKKHFFASFFFRDEAYRLIVDGWSQHNTGANSVIDRQESKPDTSSQDNGLVLFEIFKSFRRPINDICSVDRVGDAYVSEESKCSEECKRSEESKRSSNSEDDLGVSIKLSELHENGAENAECSSHGESLIWKVEDVDAPKIPEYYTIVAESKFPVEEFFNLFFSDEAINFVETFHNRCRDKDYRCTPWNEHEQYGHSRDVSFQHPIKLYFGARFGQCREVQKFRVYRNGHLIIETSQEVNDVPYGDYFRVEGLWDVEEDDNGSGSCILRVYVNVAFSKKTMWKGKIEQSTVDECREAYAVWISIAYELLKKKQTIAISEGAASDAANAVQNNDDGLESSTTLERPSASTRALPHRASDTEDVIPQTENPVKGGLSDFTSMVSLFRESWASFCLYLKNQSHFPVMVVIAFVSIFILMQLSIIVLLTRTPEVHLISQENIMGSLAPDRTETVAWLERRVHHLKDEMLMVETRLENMRHEYILLKTYLQSLENFKPKS
ncbi:protein VASCULAR ASSOCIATED DEATH 1, chloroplastic-like isoform X2 [Magnolia sinica]|uniref:protein VASCULAR ASSOCIATED DEATH 1, chloroplastic-like isoform X2 n=1 Tax=Magnolia sinica TaxID=86752 RepID=UPI00265B3FD1|nr:protein VASCULAR ASSOCIATED DEATH 1, chloroplastic-like isoform X2 [Magnolia sinica]